MNSKVLSILEVIYSREQYVRKKEELNKCKKVVTQFEERMNIKIRR